MPEFVNGQQIQQWFASKGIAVGYQRCLEIKKQLKAMHEDVMLPNSKVIPLIWLEESYGERAYKGKKKKKDAQL